METRKCSKCGIVHPLTEEFFGRNQSTNTGGDKYFRPECKVCTKKAGQGKNKAYKLPSFKYLIARSRDSIVSPNIPILLLQLSHNQPRCASVS